MNRDNRPWRPVAAAQLSWNDDGTPFAPDFGDVYFSRDDGLAESRYVFLQGNDLPQRWSDFEEATFCIAETGFGTGLNFLLTWLAWRQQPEPRPDLHYLSVELHPLRLEDLQRSLALWPELAELRVQLLAQWPGLAPGEHRLLFEDGRVRLDLWWSDAASVLSDLVRRGPCVDAWYLDGFAPARNASMWQTDLLHSMAALSRPAASFSTFTAAGEVRRGLLANGFEVNKVAGFGRKRDSLRGHFGSPTAVAATRQPTETPWDLCRARRPGTVLVIGAGLAGCAVAAALARRNIPVQLLDAGELAGAGSANQQGILYTRLSRKHSALADFALQSFQFAARHYQHLFDSGSLVAARDGELCGSFHQGGKERDLQYLEEALATTPELAQVLNADQASEVLGVTQTQSGLWFPASGWLHPAAVCRALVPDPRISLREHCGELRLQRENERWQAIAGDKVLAEADTAVIATGCSAPTMPGLEWLPLQLIRGQTTQLPSSPALGQLKGALCHEGYIAPARAGSHCIGATFDLRDPDTALREADHRHNLEALGRAQPHWRAELATLEPGQLDGRVGFRCASPDYLPLAGPLPDYEPFLHTYAALRKNARQLIPQQAPYMPQLYISTGHGSRGLSSTPLCAELLASLICGEAAPVSSSLQRALSPARFLIRDLSRNLA